MTFGESLLYTFIFQASQETEFPVAKIGLPGIMVLKGHLLVTLGRLLYTFTVKLSWDTEL